ncbi:amidohydrolase [Pseudoxanthomonas sp. LH2527]|uniref:amidohydrolase n=1 Tax=Pseudoxanthomonas sp. LH2527 TaxID=2923249 RepID=UPI001F12F774|nr:amidohydrolase family protein [Pseudoxanthomonas sp. LH2527]MCH6483189.1 amidohydrolase [Pseudoxanthomonas sp. LH2527]
MRRLAWGMGSLVVWAGAVQAQVQVVTAARVHTSDPARPVAEAMAWDAQGRILAVGSARELQQRYLDAKRVDASGKTVIPGLIDAHGHVMGLGYALMRADLVDARDKDEVIARLRAFEKQLPPNAWLLGGGWDQNDWPGKTFPSAADLDAAFPERPVWLERVDGHAGWANSAALRAAAAKAPRPLDGDWQPEGGRIERVDGRPSGVFIDAAMALVNAVVPAPDATYRRQALEKATQAAVRNGLTGVHDMGVSHADLALMKQFADEGRLPLRIEAYADGDSDALDDLCSTGLYRHAGGRLQMRGVKLYADGALGSRGAALLEDYSDDPGNRGLLVTEPAALESAMRKARGCGVQVATHAIGDRGNRLVLDAYQRVLGDAAKTDHRWRIEHAQVVAPEEFPRFAALGVIASMQPTHATSDMPWAQDRLGPVRITGAYAWQRLQGSGVKLALGSDFPVESVDPRRGLHAAVTRQDAHGHPDGGWRAEERLSATEALRGFTADAAWAAHDEASVGRLAPGLRADFVILDEDPLAIPGEQLDDLHVRSTWVDGKAVYEAE